MPEAAINSPRVADIMAADPNVNKETRIILDHDSTRLVFFAQELYSWGSKTLFEDLKKQVEPEFDFNRRVLRDSAGLLAVLSTPLLYDSTQQAILVNSLTIQGPDNTVSRVDAYINPASWKDKESYTRFTEKIFRTILAGARKISLPARTETIAIPGTNASFTFTLPAGYFVNVDEKYDFAVFRIGKFKPLAADDYISLTIYTGHHPTLFHKEYGIPDTAMQKWQASFLQQKYDWLMYNDEKENFYLREQIIAGDAAEAGLLFHVALLTNKKDIMTELAAVTDKIKVVKKTN